MNNRLLSVLCGILLAVSLQAAASTPMTEVEFENYVFKYLTENFEERTFENTPDLLVIGMGESQLGLQNLYNTYKLGSLETAELDAALQEHFSSIFKQLDEEAVQGLPDWELAKARVRPQLAPKQYLDVIPLVHEKLDEFIIITFVLDEENSYRYLTKEDLDQFGISEAALKAAAIENLQLISETINMRGSLEADKYIAIATGDGYDAARVLLPKLREFLAAKLGVPFYAATPNRDFLILWSLDSSESFHEHTVRSVRSDYDSQPYPLSPNIFVVDKNGISVKQ